MFSAVSLRTPLTGMRCSRSAPKLAAAAPAARPSGSAAAVAPLAARCTSSRVIEPSGPDAGQRGQVDAEVLGQLAHRRLGQHRPAGADRCRRPAPATGAVRPGPEPGAGAPAPVRPDRRRAAGRRPCAGGAWPPWSAGRSRPAPRSAHPGPDRRSGPARPRPRPARPRPRPATRPTGSAGRRRAGRRLDGRRPGRCRSR